MILLLQVFYKKRNCLYFKWTKRVLLLSPHRQFEEQKIPNSLVLYTPLSTNCTTL